MIEFVMKPSWVLTTDLGYEEGFVRRIYVGYVESGMSVCEEVLFLESIVSVVVVGFL